MQLNSSLLLKAHLVALVLISSIICARGAQPAAMPHLDTISASNSIFVDDPKLGKDPFYPKSSRRVVKVVHQQPIGAPPDVSAFSQLMNAISLKGISTLEGKRLALLNNRTLQAGEQIEFKVNNDTIKIRCLEIRDKSVVIGLEGTAETKELHLRAGI